MTKGEGGWKGEHVGRRAGQAGIACRWQGRVPRGVHAREGPCPAGGGGGTSRNPSTAFKRGGAVRATAARPNRQLRLIAAAHAASAQQQKLDGCGIHLEVLGHQPRFKCREEEGGGNAAQHAAAAQHPKVVEVLGEAAQRVGDAIRDGCPLAAAAGGGRQRWVQATVERRLGRSAVRRCECAAGTEVSSSCEAQHASSSRFKSEQTQSPTGRPAIVCSRRHVLLVCERADDGAKHHGRAKAGDEQLADLAHVKAVEVVQPVHVGALQPVAGCGRGGEGDRKGCAERAGQRRQRADERARRQLQRGGTRADRSPIISE